MSPAIARRIIDESYRELLRDECAECGRPYVPDCSTRYYCSPQCAYAALLRREAGR